MALRMGKPLLIADETVPEGFGPKMAGLTEKQRRYVLAMLSDPIGNPTEWARAAGYSDHMDRCRVSGHYLAHDDRIMEAAREEARRHLDTVGPVLGVGVMFQIARDGTHKRQLEAAAMLADRAGFHAKSEHKVTVERIDNARMIELASRLAAELGVPMERIVGSNAPPMIELQAQEAVEVPSEPAAE